MPTIKTDKPEWVKTLETEKCLCVSCSYCHGSGTVSFWQYGMHDLETCEECRGRGIIEACDRCGRLEEYKRDLEDERLESWSKR